MCASRIWGSPPPTPPQTPPPPELSGHSISRQSNRRAVACSRRFPCRLPAVSRDSLTTSENAGGETPPLRRTASDPIVHGVDVCLIHRNPRTPTAHRFAAGNPGAVPLPPIGKGRKNPVFVKYQISFLKNSSNRNRKALVFFNFNDIIYQIDLFNGGCNERLHHFLLFVRRSYEREI